MSHSLSLRLLILVALVMVWVSSCSPAHAETPGIPERDAILAILGEAGQSYPERLAIAFALRNRGSTIGVYGLKVARTRSYEASAWQNASRAYNEAKEGIVEDITHRATHWLSDYDLAHCRPERMAWRYGMVETAYYETTHFYKEVR